LIETRNLDLDEKYCARHADARPGRWVQLSVSDTGTGMDAATLERIFEPFFTTKEVGKGTGLGLATVFGIMKQHGGFIEVYSEVGTGTAFHAHLPVSEGEADALRAADDAPVRGGNELILVAEDHDGMRDMAEQILGTLGYRLILAHDGEEAARKFRDHADEISLLLMDVVMPKMAGTEAYEKISAMRSGIPVIFTSGYSEQGAYLTSALRAGATVLQKPYGARSLARKVRELIDAASLANKQSHKSFPALLRAPDLRLRKSILKRNADRSALANITHQRRPKTHQTRSAPMPNARINDARRSIFEQFPSQTL
jgi:CheY-like chemotaxis protein